MRKDSAEHGLDVLQCRLRQIAVARYRAKHSAGVHGSEVAQANLAATFRDVLPPDLAVSIFGAGSKLVFDPRQVELLWIRTTSCRVRAHLPALTFCMNTTRDGSTSALVEKSNCLANTRYRPSGILGRRLRNQRSIGFSMTSRFDAFWPRSSCCRSHEPSAVVSESATTLPVNGGGVTTSIQPNGGATGHSKRRLRW
jgi:hypothetical protein